MKSRMSSPSSEVRVRLPAALLRKLRAAAAARKKGVGDAIVDAVRADLRRPLPESLIERSAQVSSSAQSQRPTNFL